MLLTQAKRLEQNFTTPLQIGWGCKLYAIATVTSWLYLNGALSKEPLPARKRDKPDSKYSLREVAKQQSISSLGEFENAEDIAELVRTQDELVVSVITADDALTYCNYLKDAIDCNLMPLVFFDVDTKTHMPIKKGGNNDHAAMVTGYFVGSDNRLKFEIFQWSTKNVFDAEDLYESSAQLPKSKPKVSYHKVEAKQIKRNEGGWYPEDQIHIFHPHVTATKERNSLRLKTNGGCRSKIVIIDSEYKITNLIVTLTDQIDRLSEKTCPTLRGFRTILQSRAEKKTYFEHFLTWSKLSSQYENMNNWDLIKMQRYTGCFSFLNSDRTKSQSTIEDAAQSFPQVRRN